MFCKVSLHELIFIPGKLETTEQIYKLKMQIHEDQSDRLSTLSQKSRDRLSEVSGVKEVSTADDTTTSTGEPTTTTQQEKTIDVNLSQNVGDNVQTEEAVELKESDV